MRLLCLILAAVCGVARAANADDIVTFGTGLSSAWLKPNVEREIIDYSVQTPGGFGVVTHFWTTGSAPAIDGVTFKWYIDDTMFMFAPAHAIGLWPGDKAPIWGTKWAGKGAKSGAINMNYKIPFGKRLRVTATTDDPKGCAFYCIIRGAENVPIVIGDVQLPTSARMNLYRQENIELQPLEYYNVVDAPQNKSGMLFMHALFVNSKNLNFLEGCYHMYTPHDASFPGIILSTGTEDYYDSAYYFDAGQFDFPVAGFTHLNTTDGVSWSAYRYHEMDPIVFKNGFQMRWRNGDANDPSTGLKCVTEHGGITVGNPSVSTVTSYAWVYEW